MKEFEALSATEGLNVILEDTIAGIKLRKSLAEEIKSEIKPPSWVKGYEAIWWAAVARYVGDKDPDTIKGDGKAYGGVTQVFKAYLKRATGYSVDDIKAANGKDAKAGDVVKDAKKEMSMGMKSGSSSAAGQLSKISGLNKALAPLMQLQGAEFIKAIRDKVYAKYLAK